MKKTILTLFFMFMALPVMAETAPTPLADHVKGSDKAPITIIEYASFTCSHCSAFYKDVFPLLNKKYIQTGKVRFIYRDFPMNRYDLMGAALAQCMPSAQYYPFIKTLFENATTWSGSPKPEDVLVQYAALGGLNAEKAKACIKDSALMDSLVARRAQAIEKYEINATPTFIINNGEDKIVGAVSLDSFSASLDKILAKQ